MMSFALGSLRPTSRLVDAETAHADGSCVWRLQLMRSAPILVQGGEDLAHG